jgi:Spy/CpxP family protein refolding chaperone
MKGRATFFIVLSIIFNLVFIGTYAAFKLSNGNAGTHRDPLGKPIFLELDLNGEQVKLLRAEREEFQARLQEMGRGIGENRLRLIDLLAASAPDRQAINQQQQEILTRQERMQNLIIEHLLHQSSIFNAEQRTRFFRLIRERSRSKDNLCAPWMSSR